MDRQPHQVWTATDQHRAITQQQWGIYWSGDEEQVKLSPQGNGVLKEVIEITDEWVGNDPLRERARSAVLMAQLGALRLDVAHGGLYSVRS